MIPDRNLDATPGQHGSNEQGDPREPDILDLIDEEVAQITPTDIEERLRATLRGFALLPQEGTSADLSTIYVPANTYLDRAAETWAQYEIRTTRRKAALILAAARAEADKAREEADGALSDAARIIQDAREQAQRIISDAHREAEQIKAQATPAYELMTSTAAFDTFTTRLIELKTGPGKEQPGSGSWELVTRPVHANAPDMRPDLIEVAGFREKDRATIWQIKHLPTGNSIMPIIDSTASSPGSKRARVNGLQFGSAAAFALWANGIPGPSTSELLAPAADFTFWQPRLVDELSELLRAKAIRLLKQRQAGGSHRAFIDTILSDSLGFGVFHRWLDEILRHIDTDNLIVIIDNPGSDYASLAEARVIKHLAVHKNVVSGNNITHIAAPDVFYPIPYSDQGSEGGRSSPPTPQGEPAIEGAPEIARIR